MSPTVFCSPTLAPISRSAVKMSFSSRRAGVACPLECGTPKAVKDRLDLGVAIMKSHWVSD